MINLDNKTHLLNNVKLTNYINLIENNPCHIATINLDNTPNLSVASDIKVLDDETILISNNEMVHTPDNIIKNENIVLTSFDGSWRGLRLTGKASYFTQGNYFDICNKFFKNENVTPKGAIVVKIKSIEGIS